MTFGILILSGAYAIGTYGWILVKGWDIPLRAWVSPLAPYTWPKYPDEPPKIPGSQVWPSARTGATATA